MKQLLSTLLSATIIVSNIAHLNAQSVPSVEEKISFLVTFGGDADTDWGDDDFCQIFFFLVPESLDDPFYIRVFDPEIGQIDI